MKRKLGYVGRGLRGYLQNHFEKVPPLPAYLEFHYIGESVQNRPIVYFQIGSGPCRLLYGFGIHGNEAGTVKLAHHFLHWVHNNGAEFKNYSLFVILCLNPDGYSLALKNPDYFGGGKIGRCNAHGVDLNRNFDTPSFTDKSIWSFGKNYSESSEVYCGAYGGSEPEIKLLADFIKNKNIGILFMFHNAGRDVMGNRNELSQKLTKIYCEKTGFRYVSDGDWAKLRQTGTAKEWCDINNIAYIEVEGSTRWGSDWKKQKEAIRATLAASSM